MLTSDVHIGEGGVAVFRTHLSHPYDRPVVATVETTDAGATAPADYTPLRRTVVFPSGSTRVVPIAGRDRGRLEHGGSGALRSQHPIG